MASAGTTYLDRPGEVSRGRALRIFTEISRRLILLYFLLTRRNVGVHAIDSSKVVSLAAAAAFLYARVLLSYAQVAS